MDFTWYHVRITSISQGENQGHTAQGRGKAGGTQSEKKKGCPNFSDRIRPRARTNDSKGLSGWSHPPNLRSFSHLTLPPHLNHREHFVSIVTKTLWRSPLHCRSWHIVILSASQSKVTRGRCLSTHCHFKFAVSPNLHGTRMQLGLTTAHDRSIF